MSAVCDNNLEKLSVADRHWRFYEPFLNEVLKEERASTHMLRYSWGFLFFMVEFGYQDPYRVLNKLEDKSPWLCWRDMFDVFQCYFTEKYGTKITPKELPMSEIEDVYEMLGKIEGWLSVNAPKALEHRDWHMVGKAINEAYLRRNIKLVTEASKWKYC